jgi:hypothetical protein
MIFKKGKISINKIFSEISGLKDEKKIIKISEFFLNVPYNKDSISETAEHEKSLTIDFEQVDCMTLLEYVEALRLSNDFESFINNLKSVRYINGIISFQNRRHFFSDWDSIPTVNNIKNEIEASYFKTVFKELNKIDEKKKWIDGLPVNFRKIKYIPKKNIPYIVDKFESASYCGFYTSKEGLDVTHVGIIIRKKDSLILRHASSIKSKVVDEPFIEYAIDKEGIIVYKPLFK